MLDVNRLNPDHTAIGGDIAGSKLRINPDRIAIGGDIKGSNYTENQS